MTPKKILQEKLALKLKEKQIGRKQKVLRDAAQKEALTVKGLEMERELFAYIDNRDTVKLAKE